MLLNWSKMDDDNLLDIFVRMPKDSCIVAISSSLKSFDCC